jgi:hypothetical protein
MLDLAGVDVNTFIFLLDFFTTEEDSQLGLSFSGIDVPIYQLNNHLTFRKEFICIRIIKKDFESNSWSAALHMGRFLSFPKLISQITTSSNFLQLLEPGDVVLADKGFPQIKSLLDDSGKGVLVVMPPFLRGECFTTNDVQETQTIASVRIHIERIMQRIKTFGIMSKFSIKILPHVHDISYNLR